MFWTNEKIPLFKTFTCIQACKSQGVFNIYFGYFIENHVLNIFSIERISASKINILNWMFENEMFLKLSLSAHVVGFLKTSNPLFEMDNFNSWM